MNTLTNGAIRRYQGLRDDEPKYETAAGGLVDAVQVEVCKSTAGENWQFRSQLMKAILTYGSRLTFHLGGDYGSNDPAHAFMKVKREEEQWVMVGR